MKTVHSNTAAIKFFDSVGLDNAFWSKNYDNAFYMICARICGKAINDMKAVVDDFGNLVAV